jgi:hypothetical protein
MSNTAPAPTLMVPAFVPDPVPAEWSLASAKMALLLALSTIAAHSVESATPRVLK